jgi:hypothetical protein
MTVGEPLERDGRVRSCRLLESGLPVAISSKTSGIVCSGIRHIGGSLNGCGLCHNDRRTIHVIIELVSSPKLHFPACGFRFSIELPPSHSNSNRLTYSTLPRPSPAPDSCSMGHQLVVGKALIVLHRWRSKPAGELPRMSEENAGLCSPGLNLVLLPARYPSAAHPSPNTGLYFSHQGPLSPLITLNPRLWKG